MGHLEFDPEPPCLYCSGRDRACRDRVGWPRLYLFAVPGRPLTAGVHQTACAAQRVSLQAFLSCIVSQIRSACDLGVASPAVRHA
jgi:hypothetical protein